MSDLGFKVTSMFLEVCGNILLKPTTNFPASKFDFSVCEVGLELQTWNLEVSYGKMQQPTS